MHYVHCTAGHEKQKLTMCKQRTSQNVANLTVVLACLSAVTRFACALRRVCEVWPYTEFGGIEYSWVVRALSWHLTRTCFFFKREVFCFNKFVDVCLCFVGLVAIEIFAEEQISNVFATMCICASSGFLQ